VSAHASLPTLKDTRGFDSLTLT